MLIETEPGERVVWEGAPAQGLRFTPMDWFVIPFTVVWLLLVVAIFGMALTDPQMQADPMVFFMLPFFLLVGLYVGFGRLAVDRMARRRTRYALTDRRAIIVGGFFGRTRRAVNLAAIAEIQFRPERRGRGTISFGSPGPFGMMPPGWPGASMFLPPSFEGVDDGERVYRLALEGQRQRRA